MIYVISDTHFCHKNVLNFTDSSGELIRHFDNIQQMHDCIITNWNETVSEQDIIYHLGDVFIGNKEEFESIWKQLKGRKRLIVGNHDDIKVLVAGKYFQKISAWRVFDKHILTHVPIHQDSLIGRVNVHGHLHQRKLDYPYFNVSVECTDYKPVALESIV
jgi:calcineurin-like phosphoesterase family protein